MSNPYAETFDRAEAERHVQRADLAGVERAQYEEFLRRFPTLSFYANKEPALAYLESRHALRYPENLRAFRMTLASVMYGLPVEVRFERFDTRTPRSDHLGSYWYGLSMAPAQFEAGMRSMLEAPGHRFFPIAQVTEPEGSGCYLAVNLEGDDKTIYEFNVLDVMDSSSAGDSILQSVYPVFASYPQMLACIAEVRYVSDQRTVHVRAQPAA